MTELSSPQKTDDLHSLMFDILKVSRSSSPIDLMNALSILMARIVIARSVEGMLDNNVKIFLNEFPSIIQDNIEYLND